EGLVVVIDPRVDDGDGHPAAVDAVGASRGRGADEVSGGSGSAVERGVGGRRVSGEAGDGRRAVPGGEGAWADRQQRSWFKRVEVGSSMAQSGATGLAGPPHEYNLPRRPPCHWLWPPRVRVGNAPPPWHDLPESGWTGRGRSR